MDESNRPFSKDFEQQAHDCLNYLYDITRLQQLPLVQHLLPDTPAVQRGQAFRRLVFKLIESLEPANRTDIRSKEARVYHIILWRYVDGLSNVEIGDRLALSERQFYREHRRALDAMTYLLWEQLQTQATHPSAEMSVQSELQRVTTRAEHATLDPAELCASVVEATRSLAAARGVEVAVQVSENAPPLSLNAQVVRQLLIVLMYQVLREQPAGAPVTLAYAAEPAALRIHLECMRSPAAWETLQATLAQHSAVQELRQTLNAALDYAVLDADRGQCGITLTLPVAQPVVLIIDDNPDAISLFQRYLGDTFQSVAARQAEEGLHMARTLRPWIIVLDIMLPTMDGWEVLQNLKNHPATQNIPVLVCSVLDTPDMALALGADGFLKKPPDQVEFLTTLAAWRASTPRPPHPHN